MDVGDQINAYDWFHYHEVDEELGPLRVARPRVALLDPSKQKSRHPTDWVSEFGLGPLGPRARNQFGYPGEVAEGDQKKWKR